MNYNRLHMRNMNYFEMLGVPPNANRKAIHKAFTKIIRKINPRGVRLTDRDKELLERAVWVRDKLKEAYKTLMDPVQRRRYLANLRESREDVERRKSQALVLFNEGMAAFKEEKFDKAKEIFMKAIKYDPNSPVYYNMLEEIRKKESSSKATKYFQGAILAFKQKNDPNRAIKLLKKAITLSPKQGIFYQKLAEIQASQPTTRMDAIQSYETALELDPGNMELRLTVANYLLKIGQKQEAANRFQEILKWNPDNMSARKALLALKKEGVVPKKTTAKQAAESEEEE
jgi:tetratricopeptide (TPR) repeat protein